MTIYYFDTASGRDRWKQLEFASDDEATQFAQTNRYDVCYKESDTKDGTPFIIVWERAKQVA